jgi:ribose transport system permease protein
MTRLKGFGREFSIVIALVIMVIIFSIIDPIYLSYSNLIDIIDQSVINGLLAIGITYAIITAGIDLSIGSIFAIVIVVVGDLLVKGVNPILAIVVGIIIGFILGVINGVLITKMEPIDKSIPAVIIA